MLISFCLRKHPQSAMRVPINFGTFFPRNFKDEEDSKDKDEKVSLKEETSIDQSLDNSEFNLTSIEGDIMDDSLPIKIKPQRSQSGFF